MPLLDVLEALDNGRYPSNEQIDTALEYVQTHAPFNVEKLSKDGQTLIKDTRGVIDAFRTLVKQKNSGDLLQYFMYHSSLAEIGEPEGENGDENEDGEDDQDDQDSDNEDDSEDEDDEDTTEPAIATTENGTSKTIPTDTATSTATSSAEKGSSLRQRSKARRAERKQEHILKKQAKKDALLEKKKGESAAQKTSTSLPSEKDEKRQARRVARKKEKIARRRERKEKHLERKEARKDKRDVKKAVGHLRTLLRLVLIQPELRKLLGDFGKIGAGIFFEAGAVGLKRNDVDLAKEIEAVQMAPEAIAQDLQQIQGTSAQIMAQMKIKNPEGQVETSEISATAQQSIDGIQTISKTTISSQNGSAGAGTSAAAMAVNDAATTAADLAKTGAGLANATVAQIEQVKSTAEAMKNVAQRVVVDRMQIAQDKGFNFAAVAKATGQELTRDPLSKVTPEQKRQLWFRFQKVCIECQKSKDYQDAIIFFIDAAESYAIQANDAAGRIESMTNVKTNVTTLRNDPMWQKAEKEWRTLLERFANGHPVQPLFDSIHDLYVSAKDDDEVNKWWREVDAYIRELFIKPGYALTSEAEVTGKALIDKLDNLNGHYKTRIQIAVQQFADYAKALATDPQNKALGDRLKKLAKDFVFDQAGKFIFKKNLFRDLRNVIFPALAAQLGFIPIPKVTYEHPEFTLVVENVALELKNLIPSIIDFKARTHVHLPVDDINKTRHGHIVKLKLKDMQIRVHSVAFQFKRTKGFPRIDDSGVANVTIGKLKIKIALEMGNEDIDPTKPFDSFFRVRNVKVKIGKLKVDIKETKHPLLFGFIKSFGNSFLVKSVLNSLISDGVKTGLMALDATLVEARLAENTEDVDVRERIEALKRLLQSYREHAGTIKVDFIKGKSELAGAHVTRWIQNQTTKNNNALEGFEWRSKAFDMGKSWLLG